MKTTLGILDLIFFSDEAHFRLSGHVSKQNMRFWALTQPHEHIQPPLNQKKSNSVVHNWIAEPFFFEDNDGNHVTINSESYIEMLQRKFIRTIRRRWNIGIHAVVFQQDGAPPHCSNRTLQYLRQHFLGDRLLSRRKDNLWHP